MIIYELKLEPNYQPTDVEQAIKRLAKKNKDKLPKQFQWCYLRESIDARRKNQPICNLRVGVLSSDATVPKEISVEMLIQEKRQNQLSSNLRPIVIGFGPAGLMAAYYLALANLCPIIIEQGNQVDKRILDVQKFWQEGELNPYSNCQFGEGGAGTFSDGKLHTGIKSELIRAILNTFVLFGAPADILYSLHPHIGTDLLPGILQKMRTEIINLGGEFHFTTRFDGFEQDNQHLLVKCTDLKEERTIDFLTDDLILAIGHSSRETYYSLAKSQVELVAKPTAMGVRIEHPQSLIDNSQYGEIACQKYAGYLPPSPYKLVGHAPNGRAVYSFCMCPGGEIIACASNYEQVVTNGMSRYARDSYFANSALLVNVDTKDYQVFFDYVARISQNQAATNAGGREYEANLMIDGKPLFSQNPDMHSLPQRLNLWWQRSQDYPELKGILMQECLEYLAFIAGGSNYFAPMMKLKDFLNINNDGIQLELAGAASYKPGVKAYDFRKILPDFIIDTLQYGITHFGQKINDFDNPEIGIYAVESRSSAPVRILRDLKTRESNIQGIYPVGEGAGYAGGITSSAVDGLKTAITIAAKYSQQQE